MAGAKQRASLRSQVLCLAAPLTYKTPDYMYPQERKA